MVVVKDAGTATRSLRREMGKGKDKLSGLGYFPNIPQNLDFPLFKLFSQSLPKSCPFLKIQPTWPQLAFPYTPQAFPVPKFPQLGRGIEGLTRLPSSTGVTKAAATCS